MNNSGQATILKREILVRLIQAFFSDNFAENTRLIPYDMRPTGFEVPYRCCIYKERAIIKDRIIAGLGFPIEEDDERTSLTTYAQKALERKDFDGKNLTVLQAACKGCVPSQIHVTDLCQGCVARPCLQSCKFGAISIVDGKSQIDASKCKKCKMCISACPYKAIVKVTLPCEEACPSGAIEKDEAGFAQIDFKKCINCGKCISACPFGAVHEKSRIIDILKALKSDKKVLAMFAPSLVGQFNSNMYKIKSALKKAGFDDAFEVAKGADTTIINEAKEFMQRLEQGQKFMTTSCCAAYNQLVKKHISEIKPFVSDTKTPLFYTAKYLKEKYPDALTLFVSPCVAKRAECNENDNIDFVMSFEELNALFIAREIDVSKCEEEKFETESSKQGRKFAISGGVAKAVQAALYDENAVKAYLIDGLNKDNIKLLKKFAQNKQCDDECNLIEVMGCSGGCIGGNSVIETSNKAKGEIEEFSKNSSDIKKVDVDENFRNDFELF